MYLPEKLLAETDADTPPNTATTDRAEDAFCEGAARQTSSV